MILNLFLIALGVLTILMSWQESKKRKVHFLAALLICIITSPLIGYFILLSFPLRNPIGCQWCGNTQNEAVYCGVCGKNSEGNSRA